MTKQQIPPVKDYNNEYVLSKRDSRKHLIFIPECPIDQVSLLLADRKSNNSEVFVMPFHIQECSVVMKSWENTREIEQFIIDLRSSQEK